MPRQPRIEYSGAIYHVMNRGDRREPIYQDGADRMGTWTHVANRLSHNPDQPDHQPA
jgi:hypothetical protein